MTSTIYEAVGTKISAVQLHALLLLRSNVFIVEQACVYDDIDGLDILASTRHLWMCDSEAEDTTIATLRILSDSGNADTPTRIGRVATHSEHRGKGLAAELMKRALALIDGPAALSAQSYLEEWYEGFGFSTTGPEILEDGIPHVPMMRP